MAVVNGTFTTNFPRSYHPNFYTNGIAVVTAPAAQIMTLTLQNVDVVLSRDPENALIAENFGTTWRAQTPGVYSINVVAFVVDNTTSDPSSAISGDIVFDLAQPDVAGGTFQQYAASSFYLKSGDYLALGNRKYNAVSFNTTLYLDPSYVFFIYVRNKSESGNEIRYEPNMCYMSSQLVG